MNILLAASSTGSAEGLVPAIKILLGRGATIKGFAAGFSENPANRFHGSHDVFVGAGIACADVHRLPAGSYGDIAGAACGEPVADLIVIGTCRDPGGTYRGMEEAFLAVAMAHAIPAIQFVDSWECWYPKKTMPHAADALAVPDQISKKVVINRGFADARAVHVTGNPAWDELAAVSQADRARARRSLKLFPEQRLVAYFGAVSTDDHMTLAWALRACTAQDRLVFVRHPMDWRDYRDILQGYPEILLQTDLRPHTLVACADVCVTHHGAVGVKAALQGKTVINCILPGDCDQLCEVAGGFPLAVIDGSKQVASEVEFRQAFRGNAVADQASLRARLSIDGGAAGRLADLCETVVTRIDRRSAIFGTAGHA